MWSDDTVQGWSNCGPWATSGPCVLFTRPAHASIHPSVSSPFVLSSFCHARWRSDCRCDGKTAIKFQTVRSIVSDFNHRYNRDRLLKLWKKDKKKKARSAAYFDINDDDGKLSEDYRKCGGKKSLDWSLIFDWSSKISLMSRLCDHHPQLFIDKKSTKIGFRNSGNCHGL